MASECGWDRDKGRWVCGHGENREKERETTKQRTERQRIYLLNFWNFVFAFGSVGLINWISVRADAPQLKKHVVIFFCKQRGQPKQQRYLWSERDNRFVHMYVHTEYDTAVQPLDDVRITVRRAIYFFAAREVRKISQQYISMYDYDCVEIGRIRQGLGMLSYVLLLVSYVLLLVW